MRKPLVAGNWKMNGSIEISIDLIQGISSGQWDSVETLVCPPFTLLSSVRHSIGDSGVKLGAQDVDSHPSGAFTGQISASMLVEQGCEYVIVGHSERRALFGESEREVGLKAQAALSAGLTPIVCLGESQDEREAGTTFDVVRRQLAAVIDETQGNRLSSIVVAYEPVWAIGTGLTATPEQAQEVHALIRQQLRDLDETEGDATRIVYGGSMKPDNAPNLMAQPDIDGGLVGGASLDADSFRAICLAADQMN
ncbi:MAG: triose-phosphate isomerase [Pseudomonadota bacterium]